MVANKQARSKQPPEGLRWLPTSKRGGLRFKVVANKQARWLQAIKVCGLPPCVSKQGSARFTTLCKQASKVPLLARFTPPCVR